MYSGKFGAQYMMVLVFQLLSVFNFAFFLLLGTMGGAALFIQIILKLTGYSLTN